ncbi:MAG: hypothetical protein ABWX67_17005 [Allosphingosinicella sp.]
MTEVAELLLAGAAFISALLLGLARLRLADAWKIWAQRCNPKNPNFRPPLISTRRRNGE